MKLGVSWVLRENKNLYNNMNMKFTGVLAELKFYYGIR